MISKKMLDALNEHMNAEFFSAYLYLSMAAYFEDANLPGFSNWMKIQAGEELAHATKFYDFLINREARVTLKAIGAPTKDWKSPLAAFEAAYDHEKHITQLINDLTNLSIKESDHASQIFLQWFVTEQVEELATTNAVIQKLRMVQNSPDGLFLVDRELASRTAEPAASA